MLRVVDRQLSSSLLSKTRISLSSSLSLILFFLLIAFKDALFLSSLFAYFPPLSLSPLFIWVSSSSSMSSSSGVNYFSQPCIHGSFMSSYSDRRSRFMRWLIRLFKGGSNQGTPIGRHPQILGEENKVWRAPGRSMDEQSRTENEELDHAMALSLAEDSSIPKGYRRPAECHEDIASALQESLDMFPDLSPAYTQFSSRGLRPCGGCKRDIGSRNYLGCMGTFWHPECFCCRHCGRAITEHEFSLSGSDPFHKSCFKELHHPRCEVCHQFIPTNGAGLIEYRSHPFWNQKYCPSHEYDSTARCCSCERLESWNSTYISLGDGRSLCFECMETAIMDTGDCQSLYHAIRDYYEGMNMKLDQQIPMLLVERQALNEAIEGEKNGYHHMPETRGLCLSEEQTVTSIHKRPKFGGNRLVGMKTQQQKLTRKCEVTAILVLYGLPRLLTGSILAHELMHGWLRLKGYRNLCPQVEEGICQVLSYMWLESEVMPGSTSMPSTSSAPSSSSSKKGGQSDTEKRLGQFFLHLIAQDTSTAYGEGFRSANAAVNSYGLRRTLDHIRLTGNFPV